MARDDEVRWDERYRDGDWADIDRPAAIVEDALPWLSPPGLVLDAACGAGRNSLHLARLGFKVIGIDISLEGLRRLDRRARAEDLPVHPIHADLEHFELPRSCFDVIINTQFLLRPLFPLYRDGLKVGGLVVVETYNVDEVRVLGGDIRREYALEHGELESAFSDFEILLSEEGVFPREEGERGLARLIARKPAR